MGTLSAYSRYSGQALLSSRSSRTAADAQSAVEARARAAAQALRE